MNNLSDSAKKKIEEASENFKLSDIPYPPLKNIFKAGYNAGYEVGRDEMNQQVQLLEDALKFYGTFSPRQHPEGYYEIHISPGMGGEDRFGTKARQALESLSQLRGGGDE